MGADRLTRDAKLQPWELRAAVSTRWGALSHPSSTALPADACTVMLRPGMTAVWFSWGGSRPQSATMHGALLTLQLTGRRCEVCLPRCIRDAHCQGAEINALPCRALSGGGPAQGLPALPRGSGGEDGLDVWEWQGEATTPACVGEWKFHAPALGVVRPAAVGGRCRLWCMV